MTMRPVAEFLLQWAGSARWLALVAILGLTGPVRGEGAASHDGALIDHVWAGHPVGFALLVERGYIVVAYYDASRALTVAARAPGATEWTKVKLEGVWNRARDRSSTVIGWDSHNSVVLAADRDGQLHLSGNMHVDPLVYFRTRRPFDITSFERVDRMTGDRETRCTYPHFFEDQSGELYFTYRDGSSGDASELYNRYDRATATWHRHIPVPLHDGEGLRSAYSLAPTLGPDGRFHLLWMWRDTPDARTNQKLGYARSADLLHWEDAHGRPFKLPITFAQGERVDPAEPGEGLINTTYTLGFDGGQRPVAFYHRYDAQGHSQIFAARPDRGGWTARAVTDWRFRWDFGGNGSLQTDVYLLTPRLAPDGTLRVPYTAAQTASGILQIDPEQLALLEVMPPEPPPLAPELMKPSGGYPGLGVRTRSASADGRRYVLRWETLSTNRDQPRAEAPPPSELRLFEMSSSAGVSE